MLQCCNSMSYEVAANEWEFWIIMELLPYYLKCDRILAVITLIPDGIITKMLQVTNLHNVLIKHLLLKLYSIIMSTFIIIFITDIKFINEHIYSEYFLYAKPDKQYFGTHQSYNLCASWFYRAPESSLIPSFNPSACSCMFWPCKIYLKSIYSFSSFLYARPYVATHVLWDISKWSFTCLLISQRARVILLIPFIQSCSLRFKLQNTSIFIYSFPLICIIATY